MDHLLKEREIVLPQQVESGRVQNETVVAVVSGRLPSCHLEEPAEANHFNKTAGLVILSGARTLPPTNPEGDDASLWQTRKQFSARTASTWMTACSG